MNKIDFQDFQLSPIPDIRKIQAPKEQKNLFYETLKRSLSEVNKLKKEADHAIHGLVVTKEKDIHQTMIALEKADVSFQLLMQVRNKIITSYQEIMRMNL